MTIEERFWSKADMSNKDGCWPWTGAISKKGYARFFYDGKNIHAHRLAFTLAKGLSQLPSLWVLHRCDNRRCVNPTHLFLGTNTDNMRDMTAKGRHPQANKTCCKNGHPYTPENTRWHRSAGRIFRDCHQCVLIHQRKRYHAKRKGTA